MSRTTDRPFRILLAEDVKMNQLLTLKLLSRSGYQIEVVGNGREAVEAVRQQNYDVILMDVQMPEMDGLEATQHIRALPSPKNHIPIIALTAHAMDNDEQFRATGMDDYVAKPINFDILFTKLSVIARQREG